MNATSRRRGAAALALVVPVVVGVAACGGSAPTHPASQPVAATASSSRAPSSSSAGASAAHAGDGPGGSVTRGSSGTAGTGAAPPPSGGTGGGTGGGTTTPEGSAGARTRTSGGEVQQPGNVRGHLRTLPDGVVLLEGHGVAMDDATGTVSPVAGDAGHVWTPSEPLPAAEPSGRRVDVFYTPHPDDETLSMGVLVAAAVRRGDRVIVVALTDGRTTGAVQAIEARLAAARSSAAAARTAKPGRTAKPRRTAERGGATKAVRPTRPGAASGGAAGAPVRGVLPTPVGKASAGNTTSWSAATARPASGVPPTSSPTTNPPAVAATGPTATATPGDGTPSTAGPGTSANPHLTPEQIAAARLGELRRATADLGVAPADVFLAHLDAPGSDGGTRATVAEVRQVMAAFAAQFPGATHVTMSDVAERQVDHLDAGVALHQLLDAHEITSAQWAVSRLYWEQPTPAWSWVLPDATARQRVRQAAQEYQTWEPDHGEYAVGFFSVRWQFAALGRDVRARVHGTGPLEPGL